MVRAELCNVFEQWGKPGSMRVDNGEPLGNSSGKMIPALSLWLIGHDVDMIWNQPHCPKQNAVVERMQGTSQRWAEVDTIPNWAVLQQRLDEESQIQRSFFPVSRLAHRTRLESYPELRTHQRLWDPQKEGHFCEKRVYSALEQRVFVRKSSTGAQINLFGQRISIGKKENCNIYVQVKFCKETMCWKIFNQKTVVKEVPAWNLSREHLLNLTVFE